MATATNKTYLVIDKNGDELKTLKTLAAAKKLADAENGAILADGELVYQADQTESKAAEEEIQNAKPVDKTPERFRVKVLMNIRKEPALSGMKVGTAKQGTIVEVNEIRNDWLCLTNGTYILYGNGKFAEKV